MSDALQQSGEEPAMAGEAWTARQLEEVGLDGRFRSERVAVDNVALHVVIGGEGPPLLLIPGWPQTWYAWRRMMPALALVHHVVAVDPRGFGGSDAPTDGYDTVTVAAELVRLMSKLGHDRFAVCGHDVGAWIVFSMAAGHADQVIAAVLADAIIPGLVSSPPLFLPEERVAWAWHFAFNRSPVAELLTAGREEVLLRSQFDHKLWVKDAIGDDDVRVYARALQSPSHLRASFAYYRALSADIRLNQSLEAPALLQPVLALGAEHGLGARQGEMLARHAPRLSSAVLGGCGHYIPEEMPEEFGKLILTFLRDAATNTGAGP